MARGVALFAREYPKVPLKERLVKYRDTKTRKASTGGGTTGIAKRGAKTFEEFLKGVNQKAGTSWAEVLKKYETRMLGRMTMASKTKSKHTCFSNDQKHQNCLEDLLPKITRGQLFFAVWITGNETPWRLRCSFPKSICPLSRDLPGLPVHTHCLDAWREWASNRNVADLKMAFLQSDAGETEVRNLIMERCSEWLKPLPQPEKTKICKGDWVQLARLPKKHDPSLLSMMFGSMG